MDEIVESARAHFGLGADSPLISTGGSMGGLSSLIFCRYTRHRVTACASLFPVCDLVHHFTERDDLPRTIRQAFLGYPEPLEELLREHSPLHQVPGMPDIPYHIIHGDADGSVNKAAHSDVFVAAMKKAGRKVEYIEVPGLGHNDQAIPFKMLGRRIEFVGSFLA